MLKFDFSKGHLRCQTFKLEPSTEKFEVLRITRNLLASKNFVQPILTKHRLNNAIEKFKLDSINSRSKQTTTPKGFLYAS